MLTNLEIRIGLRSYFVAYLSVVVTYSRVCINRVRLPILLVVS